MSNSTNYPIDSNYSFILQIDGFDLKVTYKRSAFNEVYDPNKRAIVPNLIHFDFYGVTASVTGYKSYFTYLEELEEFADDPREFAQAYAEFLYREVKKVSPEKFNRAIIDQYQLF